MLALSDYLQVRYKRDGMPKHAVSKSDREVVTAALGGGRGLPMRSQPQPSERRVVDIFHAARALPVQDKSRVHGSIGQDRIGSCQILLADDALLNRS